MTEDIHIYYDIIEALDEGDFSVSKWEADFIDGLLRDRPGALSQKQRDVIDRMNEQYLDGRE